MHRYYKEISKRWMSSQSPKLPTHEKGAIQGYEVLTPPVGRNVSQMQAFQLMRKTKGTEATPSGWRPGKATLKPGTGLVGKVWKEWKTEQAFD